ncbi:SRPBCC family protein [Labilibaculum antarcticum]|uniref:ATPase n=1 Tax=Labilibaculum antarcticum TaxID=1717717 RepID=A0A1Y1CLT8_9BACT|nr:SRPBCC domain-containing protein [Labilibaculum antarcticum]BAX81389.1 ATPase [Labilibaculum antarcticum]
MSDRSQAIFVQQSFNKTREQVWNAITDLTQMQQWFFENIPDFIPEVGFETRFNVDAGERQFMHLWKITEVVPLEKIVYDWRYENISGVGTLSFKLLQEGEQILLRLTNKGMDSFPKDIPEFSRESCKGGWQYFINQRLNEFIES